MSIVQASYLTYRGPALQCMAATSIAIDYGFQERIHNNFKHQRNKKCNEFLVNCWTETEKAQI